MPHKYLRLIHLSALIQVCCFIPLENFIASRILYLLFASLLLGLLSAIKMNAVGFVKTPVKIYQNVLHNIQKIRLFPKYHIYVSEVFKM